MNAAKNDDGWIVIVNITSFAAKAECVLSPGEHPWIKRPSAVNFGDAKLLSREQAARIPVGVQGGVIIPQPKLDDGVLARIVAAARKSRGLPRFLRAYL